MNDINKAYILMNKLKLPNKIFVINKSYCLFVLNSIFDLDNVRNFQTGQLVLLSRIFVAMS